MFFVTVGQTQPFDRLIRLVDEAAAAGLFGPGEVFAQIGAGRYEPQHLRYERFLEPGACRQRLEEASATIAHAGVGTIASAIAARRPLIAVPRRSELEECVDDHQVRTALMFSELGHILTAQTLPELASNLERAPSFVPAPRAPRVDPLCERLASFVSVCEAGLRGRLPALA